MRLGDEVEHSAAVELFNTTFEQDAMGMALRAVDPHNSRWLRVNQKFCDMLGYTREELLQLTSVEISPPNERHLAVKYNEQLLRGDISSYSREKRYLRKDGTKIWTNIWLSAVLDPDGNPTQIISVIQDISERKAAEEALRVSEQNYRALLENAAAGIGRSRITDGKVLLANRKLARMFGYERVEQFVAEFSFVDHYVDPGERERLIALYKNGTDNTVEVSFTTRDGSVVTVANQGWADEKAGHIDFVMTDITERKRAEEALRESEERFRSVIDNSPSFITLKDTDGRYQLVNRKHVEMIGHEQQDVVGKSSFDFFPEKQAIDATAQERKVIETNSAITRERQVSIKQGTRDFLITKFPILDGAGDAIRIGTIGTDITERKRAEEALRLRNQELLTLHRISEISLQPHTLT